MSELARFEQVVDQSALLAKRYSTPEHQIQVAVDEWGTWHPQANPYNGCRQDNTMKDALFAAALLPHLPRPRRHGPYGQ